MKIAIISSSVFAIGSGGLAGYGGLEQIAWQRAKGLALLGHKVTLIAPDGSSCPGCEVIETGPPGQWDESKAYGGHPEIKQGDVVVRKAHPGYWQKLLEQDVIIDDSWMKNSYLLKMEGRLKAPILGVLHAPVNTMLQTLPPIEKPCFVCISDDQRNHFEALFEHEGRTARNGIDLDFYKPLNVQRTNRFLFLARFSSIKGPDIAIEACKKAGVGLDLVGDTSITNEPELYQKCVAMADGEQIRIVGPATRAECVRWFSQAHCLLHPNKHFREPFGLAPVEAMACDCPVIAWDRGAMRETIKNGEVGWLVKSEDELVGAITQLKNYNSDAVRKHCREWASRFSVENMAKRYEELCKEAIETGGW